MEDTQDAIHNLGHRLFVGGGGEFWDLIGEHQFKFLLDQGLEPADRLLDVACGSLRGGARFIRYLDPGHYMGIDKYIELILYGVAEELGIDSYREKRPKFVVSDTFEFEKFEAAPTFAMAQSLFTHLTASDVAMCLTRLRAVAAPGCRFFATFFEVDEAVSNPGQSHSHGAFRYTRAQMERFGTDGGWSPRYIGDWGHPRGQLIIEYTAK